MRHCSTCENIINQIDRIGNGNQIIAISVTKANWIRCRPAGEYVIDQVYRIGDGKYSIAVGVAAHTGLRKDSVGSGSRRRNAMTNFALSQRSGKSLQRDLLDIIAINTACDNRMRLAMTYAAEESAMPSRHSEQFAGLFRKIGTMTLSRTTRWFFKPRLATTGDALPDLRHTTVTILAYHSVFGAHNITQALSVGARMTFVAIVGSFAMLLVNRLRQ